MTTVSLVDDALPLEGLDVDQPLPYPIGPAAVTLVDELGDKVAQLRRALTEALDAYVDAMTGQPQPLAAPRFRALRELTGNGVEAHQTPEERKVDGIARAAARWTPEESARVDAAIRAVVERGIAKQRKTIAQHRAAGYGFTDEAFPAEFTTADVWAELGSGFPVTKGIAGRMNAARAAGLIRSTGRTIIIPATAAGPNHGQRLTVWTPA